MIVGCTTSQSAVARMMSNVRRIDGVERVSLESSEKADAAGRSGGGGGGGGSGGGSGLPQRHRLDPQVPDDRLVHGAAGSSRLGDRGTGRHGDGRDDPRIGHARCVGRRQ